MTIDKAYVRALVPAHIYSRGVQYYRDGRAVITQTSDRHVRATVRGARAYQVDIFAENGHLSTFCDCPHGAPCKHVVAALLQADAPQPVSLKSSAKTEKAAGTRLLDAEEYFQKFIHAASPVEAESAVGSWRLGFVIRLETGHWSLQPAKFYLKQDGGVGRRAKATVGDFLDLRIARTPADHAAVTHLVGLHHAQTLEGQHRTHPLEPFTFDYGADIAGLMANLQGCLLVLDEEDEGSVLDFSTARATLRFRFERRGADFVMALYARHGEQTEKLAGNFHVLTSEPIWLLLRNRLFQVENMESADPLLPFCAGASELRLSPSEMERFVSYTLPKLAFAHAVEVPGNERVRIISQFSKRRLYLSEDADILRVEMSFVYGPRELAGAFPYHDALHFDSNSGECIKIARDMAAERQAAAVAEESGLYPRRPGVFENEGFAARDWLLNRLPALAAQGFEIYGEDRLQRYRMRRAAPRIEVAVSSGQDWFDLDMDIDFDGAKLSVEELRRAFLHESQFVRLSDGSSAQLSESWRQLFGHLFRFSKRGEKKLRLSRYHLTLIDQLFREADAAKGDTMFSANLKKLRHFKGIRKMPVPRELNGKLRPYQHAGLNWFYFLQEFGFGGCLADDMGLGKTIQALVLLLNEKKREAHSPSLIVAPTSVVFNWQNEIARFTPSLRVLTHTGSERRRGTRAFQDYDVILTTYGTLRRDIAFLKDFDFHYVILDESQNIKNAASQTGKAARLLRSSHRLALSGTPLENSTSELWSQFAFLNPGLLGPLREFQIGFSRPIERDGDQQSAAFLQKLVYPFILRRTKGQVAKELPPKVESVYYCVMGDQQRLLYNHLRDVFRAAILGQIEKKGLHKSRMKVLEGLLRLRQVACHPRLIPTCRDFEGDIGKMQALQELLEDILAENHKVLIFSQFVQMLKIIRRDLDEKNIRYEYLDGQTRNRQACVERFQNDPGLKIFLISLRAGGTGLNLTAADYVIHYDPWWNPAVEAQATDRTHRIGQRQSVFSYKLISKDTVEEKILELQKKKRLLVERLIVTDAGLFKQLSVEDITGLFS
jgi:non-specific serine/threonine protein kinase